MTVIQDNPPLGGTVSRIRSLIPSLGPSEQRVASECVEAPDVVAMLSVADLAARTETSSATVIRTCQNLGFKGFQHLRLLLLRDLGSAAHDAHGDAVVPEPGTRGRVAAVFEAASRDLRDALGGLDVEQFEGAAAALASARRVLVVGNGGSGPPAQMVALRLITSQRPCEAPVDAVTQQLSARLLGAGDVCLAISDSGMNGVTLRAVEAAHRTEATVIGVTSYARSTLSELADFSVVAGANFASWGDGAISGNVTQMVILSALQSEVGRVLGVESSPEGVIEEVFGLVEGGPVE